MAYNLINDIEHSLDSQSSILTRFLDMNEQEQVSSLQNKYDITFFGGYKDAERVRAFIGMKDASISKFHITCLKLTKPKTLTITHRNILGTIMSLGFDRSYIGDIVLDKDVVFIMIDNEITDFTLNNLTKINNEPIILEKISSIVVDNIIKPFIAQKQIITPSMRLDALVAHCFNQSRTVVIKAINSKLLFVNHKNIMRSDYLVKEEDLISYRGFGRVKINQVLRQTKKDKIAILVQIY